MAVLRSLLFTAFMFASVLPWSLVIIVSRMFGPDRPYPLVVLWSRAMLSALRAICGLGFRVEGLESIPSRNSVVMIKHSSAFETIAQMVIFPRQAWILKRELMYAPFLGWALAVLQPIAINRAAGRKAVEQVLEQGRAQLELGRWIMIFPEGTRMPPGETRRYGLSGVLLAQATGRLLVPVAHDAGDFWPRRGLRKRPGTISVRIGPSVDPANRDPREVNLVIQSWIETEIAQMRGVPPPSLEAFR